MEEVEEMIVAGYNNEEEDQMIEYNFTAYEIDLDYEFDAVRYFDFTRVESLGQASRAEAWFDSAPSYEPSPFVARLVPRLEMGTANTMGNMNLSEIGPASDNRDDEIFAARKSHQDEVKDKITSSCLNVGSQHKFQATSQRQKLQSGFTFYNHMADKAYIKNQSKSSMKPTLSRTTNLMKPTASLLAKQNHPFQAVHNRSLASEKSDKSFVAGTCVIENQASKRQKLESGLLRKVEGAAQMQQTNFVHKAPKQEGLPDRIIHTKSRITVPRGPALETACRAQKTRSKNIKEVETATSAVHRFKALPLNRKILEAPAPSLLPKKSTPRIPDFQEFHFKTSERAMQHSLVASKFTTPYKHDKHGKFTSGSSTAECGNPDHAWPSLLNTSRPDGRLTSSRLKALSVNKKILTSKEDKGNFRSNKNEVDFNIEKKYPHNPPIELFNKLSLASDSQPVRKCEPKLPWSISAQTKGSKENRRGFQQVNELQLTGPAKTKPPPLRAINQQF